MMKKMLLPVIALTLILGACNKANDELSAEDMLDQSLYSLESRSGIGRYGCFELVFPVAFTLPDGTTTEELNSYEDIRQTLRRWFQANGIERGRRGRRGGFWQNGDAHPSFVFPITVVTQDGETVSVEDETALRELAADCRGTFGRYGWQGHSHQGISCFEVIFPVTIQFPDGSTVEAADGRSIGQAVRTWRRNNPDATERPTLVFPVTVRMNADQSLVVVNSREEFFELKAGCR